MLILQKNMQKKKPKGSFFKEKYGSGGALICLLKSNNSTSKRRSEKRFSALYSPSNSLSDGYKFDFEIKNSSTLVTSALMTS